MKYQLFIAEILAVEPQENDQYPPTPEAGNV
jgi:hypothetical protein